MTNVYLNGFMPGLSLSSGNGLYFLDLTAKMSFQLQSPAPAVDLRGESLVALTDKEMFKKVSNTDYLQQRSVVQFNMKLVAPKVH